MVADDVVRKQTAGKQAEEEHDLPEVARLSALDICRSRLPRSIDPFSAPPRAGQRVVALALTFFSKSFWRSSEAPSSAA